MPPAAAADERGAWQRETARDDAPALPDAPALTDAELARAAFEAGVSPAMIDAQPAADGRIFQSHAVRFAVALAERLERGAVSEVAAVLTALRALPKHAETPEPVKRAIDALFRWASAAAVA